MNHFEYDITKYTADELSQIVFFCSDKGECGLEDVPNDQVQRLKDVLNERGADGWELVQLSFGSDGVVAFWKRRK
jgi:hypothetical protein